MSTPLMSPRLWIEHVAALTADYPVTPYAREDSLAPAWRLAPGATQAGVLGALQALSLAALTPGPNAAGYAAAADRVRALVRLVSPVTGPTRLTDYALRQLAGVNLAVAALSHARMYAHDQHLDRLDPAAVACQVSAELCLSHEGLRMTRALRVMSLLAVEVAARRVRSEVCSESATG